MGFKKNKIFQSKGFQIVCRLILGCVFIYASIDKIAFPNEFAKIVQNYNVLPEFSLKIVAYLLPWVELILGIFLIVGLFVKVSAVTLSSLMVTFMLVMGIKSLSGPIEDCGCFPKSSIISSSNVIFLLIRDVLFISLGVILILQRASLKRLNKIEQRDESVEETKNH